MARLHLRLRNGQNLGYVRLQDNGEFGYDYKLAEASVFPIALAIDIVKHYFSSSSYYTHIECSRKEYDEYNNPASGTYKPYEIVIR